MQNRFFRFKKIIVFPSFVHVFHRFSIKNMKKLFVFSLLVGFFASPIFSQKLTDARTRWSDSFTEWLLFATPDTAGNHDPQAEQIGKISLRWPQNDDFTEWNLDCDNLRGSIKLKWKTDQNRWELRADGEIITMKTRWDNDFSEWKITDDETSIILKTRFNTANEWLTDDPKMGRFYMYTLFADDPRDWAIDDRLSEKISPAMRMAMVFTVLFQSSPRQ